MDFMEKARIRLEHWMTHSSHHLDEYETFAEQLAAEGKADASAHIWDIVSLTIRMNASLEKALAALK